jgi:hypothetical protein
LGQNKIEIKAELMSEAASIAITQRIIYQNTSQDTLSTIYLSDWNHSYSSKNTPLAKHFEEEFNTKFHLAKDEDRGFTSIEAIKDDDKHDLSFTYLEDYPDVIKVELQKPLFPGENYDLNLRYSLQLPNIKFTGYGVNLNQEYVLNEWYISPVVYDGSWQYYSNKNLNDQYVPISDISLELKHPKEFKIITELDLTNVERFNDYDLSKFTGKNRVDNFMQISRFTNFSYVSTDDFTIISDLNEKGLSPEEKAILTDKITRFITEELGPYPHKKLVVSKWEYDRNPLYGLNQLPDFLQPFQYNFQYELKLLKTSLQRYLDNVLITNPRQEYWLSEAIQIYFMIAYVNRYYPDSKLLGSLADVWGVRSLHAADKSFNFQYFLYFMEMARRNNDQALTIPKDSLIKFNAQIAGKYKAGMGFVYLDSFLENEELDLIIKDYLKSRQLKATTINDFEAYLKQNTTKDINWFFNDYVGSRVKMDYKIKRLKMTEDSIEFTVKNKRNNQMPISIFTLQNDSIISKTWVNGFKGRKTFTIPKDSIDRIALDYDNLVPEFNQRDNYKSTKGFFLNRKPLQLRLFKDIEDPYYNQVYVMPKIEFNNIYDGLTLGAKLYNTSVLRKRFNYRFSPHYSLRSKSVTGSGSVFYTHNIENQNLFNITYGMVGSYRSFAEDAFVTTITPSISFVFRDDNDFRKDVRDFINARFVSISRDVGPDAVVEVVEPDYDVFNLRYVRSSPGLINYSRVFADYQYSRDFSKVAINYEYRKLSQDNRNYGVRFFGGLFLSNNTNPSSDYFSFALDRPTDYLFDFNYFGRSEDTGLFSQQIIIAEGGFKSQLEPAFANQWMTTLNFWTSIWRYIHAYGDIGLVKNRGLDPVFVYDAGVRLVLVEDYFEIFFPVYSNLGWEIAQPNYDRAIRFMFTLDLKVLSSLFTRKWY